MRTILWLPLLLALALAGGCIESPTTGAKPADEASEPIPPPGEGSGQ